MRFDLKHIAAAGVFMIVAGTALFILRRAEIVLPSLQLDIPAFIAIH